MFKLNNRNTRTRCEIGSKLTIKIPKRCQWRRFNFKKFHQFQNLSGTVCGVTHFFKKAIKISFSTVTAKAFQKIFEQSIIAGPESL